MDKIIGVTEMQRKFRAVFDEVAKRSASYVLTRGSRPEAVMIPYEQYLRFVQLDEAGVIDRFNKLLMHLATVNSAYSEDEVERDLAEASRRVRKRKRK